MSSGIGRFKDRRTKIRYLQKKADEENAKRGYTEDYYETFDKFNPVLVKKQKKLFEDFERKEKLPFEEGGNVCPSIIPRRSNLSLESPISG